MVVLRQGKVVEEGPADALFADPRQDYTRALMAAAFGLVADKTGAVAAWTAEASELLINIDVPDLASAVAFYQAAFDLRVGRRFGDDAVELLGWSAPLLPVAEARGLDVAPAATSAATTGTGRRFILMWSCSTLTAATSRALAGRGNGGDTGARTRPGAALPCSPTHSGTASA